MTPLDHLIQSALDAPDQGPATEREIAAHTVSMALSGAYQATSELIKLRCDPIAAAIVAANEGELWAIKTRVDFLISEIRTEQDLRPVPALRLVR